MSAVAIPTIKDLPRVAKLRLMEELWDDLCNSPEAIDSPTWHGEVLAARSARLASGVAQFNDWEEVKARLLARQS